MTENVQVNRTRAAIPTQLQEFFTAAGIDFHDTYTGGGQTYEVDGRLYTPGGAANRFLPGGFSGAFGQSGKLPRYRLGDTVRHAPNEGGAPIDVVVVALYGAARYPDGYLAVCLDATGSAHVLAA